MLSGTTFWRWYALAWLVLAAIYCVIFLVGGADTVPAALIGGVAYVLPMAIYGTAAVAIVRRIEWGAGRARFVAVHAVAGLVYGALIPISNHQVYRGLHRLSPEMFRAPQLVIEYLAWGILMSVLIYGVLTGICYAIVMSRRAARATALRTEAELRALRAQLNPHFLFNTLHSLLALVRHDPGGAEEALVQFGDLLRYTLDTQKNGEVVPLGDELDFVDNYLKLESLRLGDRLQLDVDVDTSARDRRVPAFCLQPLVENAVRHGIAPRASGGRLSLRVARDETGLMLEVTDDGPGATERDLAEATGIGLRLVRERIAAHYGSAARLDVETRPGEGMRVVMHLPAEDA